MYIAPRSLTLLAVLAFGCADAKPKREIVTTGSAEGEFVFARGSCTHQKDLGKDGLRSKCEIDSLEVRVVGSPEKVLPCGTREFELTCPKGGVLFPVEVLGDGSLKSVVACEAVGAKQSSHRENLVPPFPIRAECVKGPKPGTFAR